MVRILTGIEEQQKVLIWDNFIHAPGISQIIVYTQQYRKYQVTPQQ